MNVNVTKTLEMPIWWPDNVSVGFFFFLLGVTGAAIIVYLGSWDKLMGNTSRILELQEQVGSFRDILKKTTDESDKDRMWQEIVRKENELNREKWFFRYLGIIIYLFVGGMVASILAKSMLEAVAFGAGWTGLIGVFGIKKDVDERMKRVDKDKSQDDRDVKTINDKIELAQAKMLKDYEDKIRNARAKMLKDYEDKINKARVKIIKDCENKIVDAYYDGYADGIEAVAKVKGEDSQALTEKIIDNL